jgi:hypothetical protein
VRPERGATIGPTDDDDHYDDYGYPSKPSVLFLCFYENVTCLMVVLETKHVADRYIRI